MAISSFYLYARNSLGSHLEDERVAALVRQSPTWSQLRGGFETLPQNIVLLHVEQLIYCPRKFMRCGKCSLRTVTRGLLSTVS